MTLIIISYEAMHEDAAKCPNAILNFFGCPRPDHKVRAAGLTEGLTSPGATRSWTFITVGLTDS
jgi:hypothetical protein